MQISFEDLKLIPFLVTAIYFWSQTIKQIY